MNEASVREALAKVVDPALGHDIVAYRVLRGIEVSGRDVLVKLDIPTHAYPLPLRRELTLRIEKAVKAAGANQVSVIADVTSGKPVSFYVDKECILCSVCSDAAPNNFRMSDEEDHDICFKQPENEEEERLSKEAMEGCPVEAIGSDGA